MLRGIADAGELAPERAIQVPAPSRHFGLDKYRNRPYDGINFRIYAPAALRGRPDPPTKRHDPSPSKIPLEVLMSSRHFPGPRQNSLFLADQGIHRYLLISIAFQSHPGRKMGELSPIF